MNKPYTLADVKLAIAYEEERMLWEARRGNFEYAKKLKEQIKIVRKMIREGKL